LRILNHMKRVTSTVLAIAISTGVPAFAQNSPAADSSRTDAVVREAMKSYQQGLNDLKEVAPLTQPGTSSGALRELRLEDAVTLALEKNLDIQVAKLEPQSVDFLVAGFRNTYLPTLSSTVGQRGNYQL